VSSTFHAQNAQAYEQVMGQWSRRLAPLLIGAGGDPSGDRVLDVGCGTGSLTFALAAAGAAKVTGIDFSQAYVDFARDRNSDIRIEFDQGDACDLPYDSGSFDRAYANLVLQFVPDRLRAVVEMRRVVRSGGLVTAAVWDEYAGLPHNRMLWDTAGVLFPDAPEPRALFRGGDTPAELGTMWRGAGLQDLQQTELLVRIEFASFDEYWTPRTSGEGPVARFTATLSASARAQLLEHVRRAYLANRPDGPRSFPAVAWACTGVVP
jgi:SAM-dependent methyltransferase